MDKNLQDEIDALKYEKCIFDKILEDERISFADSVINGIGLKMKEDITNNTVIKIKPKKTYLIKKWFYNFKRKFNKAFLGENEYGNY